MEVFAGPFPDKNPAGRCVEETPWDTRTPNPALIQMGPCCKTPLSENTNQKFSSISNCPLGNKTLEVILPYMYIWICKQKQKQKTVTRIMRWSKSFRNDDGSSLSICKDMCTRRASSSARLRSCFTCKKPKYACYIFKLRCKNT